MELNADRPELLDVPEQSESHSASDSEIEPSHAESEQKQDEHAPSVESRNESETPEQLQARKDDVLTRNRAALEEHFKCCIPQGEIELEDLTGDKIMEYARVGELMDRIAFHRQSLRNAMQDFARATRDYPVGISFKDDEASVNHEMFNDQGMEEKE